jgi:hypothetical protein
VNTHDELTVFLNSSVNIAASLHCITIDFHNNITNVQTIPKTKMNVGKYKVPTGIFIDHTQCTFVLESWELSLQQIYLTEHPENPVFDSAGSQLDLDASLAY